jgi:drug/metabolite transporter (DMT)-like permease
LILPTFLYALFLWADLWIAYKIQSYSIFVPIIFSVIFYEERITRKKLLAIVLATVSLWFFI